MYFKLYTFKSFPLKSELSSKDQFVFNSLKADLEIFKKILLESQPDLIIGISKTKYKSCIESKTVNVYNKSKKVNGNKKREYELYIPNENPFTINKSYTDSFCNWVMFNISTFVEEREIKLKHMFIHLNSKDIELMNSLVKKLKSQ